MNAFEDAQYRLKIAQGFLMEARQDVQLERWRSGMDNAQLTPPRELFSEKDAREALVMAEEAYALAEEITRSIFQ